jgi:hypothetical protein
MRAVKRNPKAVKNSNGKTGIFSTTVVKLELHTSFPCLNVCQAMREQSPIQMKEMELLMMGWMRLGSRSYTRSTLIWPFSTAVFASAKNTMITCINETSSSVPRMPLSKNTRSNTSKEGKKIMSKRVHFAPVLNSLHSRFNHLSVKALLPSTQHPLPINVPPQRTCPVTEQTVALHLKKR